MQQTQVSSVTKTEAGNYAGLLASKTLGCKVDDVRYIGGGSFGWVFRVHTDFVPQDVILKACRAADMAQPEADALALLGQDTVIRVPRVYFTHLADDTVPMDFICMEALPGSTCFADPRKLCRSRQKREAFADEVTSAIRYWHCRKNEKFGLIGDARFDTWLDFYRPFALDILETARSLAAQKKLEHKVLAAMERARDAFDVIFEEPVTEACLIHGDMNVMNILADASLKPLAVIDPLDTKWADCEYELFQLRNLTGDRFGLYQAYVSKYPVSRRCAVKTAFYGLYHEVYAYVRSGVKLNFILMPLVKRMNDELDRLE